MYSFLFIIRNKEKKKPQNAKEEKERDRTRKRLKLYVTKTLRKHRATKDPQKPPPKDSDVACKPRATLLAQGLLKNPGFCSAPTSLSCSTEKTQQPWE